MTLQRLSNATEVVAVDGHFPFTARPVVNSGGKNFKAALRYPSCTATDRWQNQRHRTSWNVCAASKIELEGLWVESLPDLESTAPGYSGGKELGTAPK